jgi:hypothetical protein
LLVAIFPRQISALSHSRQHLGLRACCLCAPPSSCLLSERITAALAQQLCLPAQPLRVVACKLREIRRARRELSQIV